MKIIECDRCGANCHQAGSWLALYYGGSEKTYSARVYAHGLEDSLEEVDLCLMCKSELGKIIRDFMEVER